MKKRARILLISSVLLMSISCKKGDMGPQGLQGERGAQGEQGVTGLKGADGSIILSGADVPAEALGKNGDYYFRTGTNVLYGPKTTSGWGAGVSLKGSNGTNGANGTNGTKILSGIDLPGVNVGVVGDFYFRTSTSVFYGPKTASGWDTGVDLKGTANVIYSGWLKATNYKDSIIDGTTVNVAHIAAPKLTQTIRSSSVILVYLDYGGGVYPLPYTSRASGRMSTIS